MKVEIQYVGEVRTSECEVLDLPQIPNKGDTISFLKDDIDEWEFFTVVSVDYSIVGKKLDCVCINITEV